MLALLLLLLLLLYEQVIREEKWAGGMMDAYWMGKHWMTSEGSGERGTEKSIMYGHHR